MCRGSARMGLLVLLGLVVYAAAGVAQVSYADLVVCGAGTPVFNDTFYYYCIHNNLKPYYQLGAQGGLRWAPDLGRWEMYNKAVVYYVNYGDTPAPPATGWTCAVGSLPAPSVSGGARLGSPEVIVTPSSGSATSEAGGQARIDVALSAPPAIVCPQPTVLVTIAISSSDTSEGTVDKATLSFSRLNWSKPQTVTLTGVDDSVDDGDVGYTILMTVSGGGYAGVGAADVTVTNCDNDMPALVPAYPATEEAEWLFLTRSVPTTKSTSGQTEYLPVVYAFGDLIEARFMLEADDGLAVRDATVALDLWIYDGDYAEAPDRMVMTFRIPYDLDAGAYAIVIPTDGPDFKLPPGYYEWRLKTGIDEELARLRMVIR